MFTDRTRLHTHRDLDKILSQNANRLANLLWCIEVRWPSNRTPTGKTQLVIASHPGRWMPMIRVGCDPMISRDYAEMLLEFFKLSNKGNGLEFGLGLVDDARLADDVAAYEWGKVEWDCVCKLCGGVFQSTNAGALRCIECIKAARREPKRKGWAK